MKLFTNIFLMCAAVVLISMMMPGCQKPDQDFIHARNTISYIQITHNPKVEGITGIIFEYAKGANPAVDAPVNLKITEGANGTEYTELVYGVDYKQEDIEGGFGIVRFDLNPAAWGRIDVTNAFLISTLDLDVICEEGFAGRHDLSYTETHKGKEFTIHSGTGTKRKYLMYAMPTDSTLVK